MLSVLVGSQAQARLRRRDCGLFAVGNAAEGLVDSEDQVPDNDEGDDHRSDEERHPIDARDAGVEEGVGIPGLPSRVQPSQPL